MNMQRMLILGLAAIAAGAAAFLARGLLGGGTPKVVALPAPQISTEQVLVAASDLQSGTALDGTKVRWQNWPRSSIDSSFITSEAAPNADLAVKGTVVRSPLVSGQPLSNTNIVHADTAGFMSASLTPGMRAVSIAISTETGAGGFILPNDRVDVVVTIQVSDNPRRFKAATILNDVRVLAMDQTFKEDKDQKVVLAKTATLELAPEDAERVAKAQASGAISLALRALGDSNQQNPGTTVTASTRRPHAQGSDDGVGAVTIIRYGVSHQDNGNKGE